MRIVTFQEFALLPEGTIFSYFTSPEMYGCHGLFRKGETVFREDGTPMDFWELDLIGRPSLQDQGPGFEDFEVARAEDRWGLLRV